VKPLNLGTAETEETAEIATEAEHVEAELINKGDGTDIGSDGYSESKSTTREFFAGREEFIVAVAALSVVAIMFYAFKRKR
jgi:hypothetical protein